MKTSYEWLQHYAESALPEPRALADALTEHSFEVESVDGEGEAAAFEIDILPNRAPSCLSHRGIAREACAVLDIPFRDPDAGEIPPRADCNTRVFVSITDKTLARRYVGLVVEGVDIAPSPEWLARRIRAAGARPINNVVDVTNYVMLDIGQPMHAFDRDKVEGGIVVRRAKEGERMTTLDGVDVSLSPETPVVADEKGALAIAGVKGGKKAEVDERTRTIILEAANFNSALVRKVSRKVGIMTDSSKRFENGIPLSRADEAIARAAELLRRVGGENVRIGIVEAAGGDPSPLPEITVRAEEICNILGIRIPAEEIVRILARLSFGVSEKGDMLIIAPPDDRPDVATREDVAEEVGRIYGYEKISPALIDFDFRPRVNKPFYYSNFARRVFTEEGFSEVYGYTLGEKGKVALANPFSSDKSRLRADLSTGIRSAVEKNARILPLLDDECVKIFEIGTVFGDAGEKTALAFAVHYPGKKGKEKAREEAERVKSVLAKRIPAKYEWKESEGVYECDFSRAIRDLPEPDSYEETLIGGGDFSYKDISPYPFVLRDIAVWVPADTGEGDVSRLIENRAGDLLARPPRLFDRFEKDGRVSYAFHLVFQSPDRTLTDEEVGAIMRDVEEDMARAGWEVR